VNFFLGMLSNLHFFSFSQTYFQSPGEFRTGAPSFGDVSILMKINAAINALLMFY